VPARGRVATKVCYVGVKMWERKAKRVAEGNGECAHRRRMEEDKVLYGWVHDRVASWRPGGRGADAGKADDAAVR
jgi:hypothetical protein